MQRRIRFTRKVIDSLPPCPPDHRGREVEYTSLEAPPGLRLVVTKRGMKSWLFRYSIPRPPGPSIKRALKIGVYPGMEPPVAIRASLDLRAQIAQGIDPQNVREQAKTAVNLDTFFKEEYFPNAQSLRNAKGVERVWQIHISPVFGHLHFCDLKTADIVRFHDAKRVQLCAATSNRILAVLKRVVNVGMLLEHCDRNPCRGVRMHDEQNIRTRTLSSDEVKRLIASLAVDRSRVVADFCLFALATAARREECLQATWSEMFIQEGVWRLPASRAKSGKSRVIPLNDIALKVLESRAADRQGVYVFPGRSGKPIANPAKAVSRILERAGISDFKIHDLRRSASTLLLNNGGSMTQAGNLLGHAPGSSLTATRYAFLGDEKLFDASRRLASAITAACEPSE